mmetsp:Transcript_16896/g.46711  ORF Transcript_16896/g.46711 Transcript_16896/m.46711 type:complete len:203 (-) Transcript_16896:81-689(-)
MLILIHGPFRQSLSSPIQSTHARTRFSFLSFAFSLYVCVNLRSTSLHAIVTLTLTCMETPADSWPPPQRERLHRRQDDGLLDADTLLEPDPVAPRTLLQPLDGIESRHDLGEAWFVDVDLRIVLRVDVEGGTAVGGKADGVLGVWELGRVLLEGDALQSLLLELLRARFGWRSVVGQRGPLDHVQSVEDEGASLEQVVGDHL